MGNALRHVTINYVGGNTIVYMYSLNSTNSKLLAIFKYIKCYCTLLYLNTTCMFDLVFIIITLCLVKWSRSQIDYLYNIIVIGPP